MKFNGRAQRYSGVRNIGDRQTLTSTSTMERARAVAVPRPMSGHGTSANELSAVLLLSGGAGLKQRSCTGYDSAAKINESTKKTASEKR